MRNLFFLFIILLISCNLKSQEKSNLSKENISYSEKDEETGWTRVNLHKPNKWGFIDKDSVIVIPFEYNFVNPFENGLAYVKNNGKEFFITKQNLKLHGDFEAINIFSEGLASAKKNEKWGFIDEEGKFVISPKYDEVDYFRPNGLCVVTRNGRSGFINKNGDEIIPIIYDEAYQEMKDKNVIVKKNGKWTVFDNSGNQLSNFIYDSFKRAYVVDFSKDVFKRDASTFFENGAALVEINEKYEFINAKAQAAFPNNKFDSASVFDTFKNAIVKRNGKYGIIKLDGTFKVPLDYDLISYFDDNHSFSEYYNAKKDKIYSIFNKNLKKIGESFEPVYNDFSSDTPTLIFKDLKNKYGMINSEGEILVPFEYDEMYKIENTQFFKVSKRNKFGIIDEKGKIRIPIQHKEIYSLYDKFDDEELCKKNLYIADNKIINIDNQVLIDGYNSIVPIFNNHNSLIVSKNKKFGIIDVDKKVLLPIEYEEISNWVEYSPENRHLIRKNGKFGMIESETFKEKIPPVYEFVFTANDRVFAGKDKKYGIIDLNNKIICPFYL